MELSEIFFLIGDYIIERGIFYPKVKVKIPCKKRKKKIHIIYLLARKKLIKTATLSLRK